jgi:hypothetical protein
MADGINSAVGWWFLRRVLQRRRLHGETGLRYAKPRLEERGLQIYRGRKGDAACDPSDVDRLSVT